MAEPTDHEVQPQSRIYDLMRRTARSSESVYAFCYGYLDSLLGSLAAGRVDLVTVRRECFQLDAARLAVLGDLQSTADQARREALARMERQLSAQKGTK